QYVLDQHGPELDRDQRRELQEELVEGMELSPKVGRMCAMNLYLHGIGGDKIVMRTGQVVPDNTTASVPAATITSTFRRTSSAASEESAEGSCSIERNSTTIPS